MKRKDWIRLSSGVALLAGLVYYIFCLPSPLFDQGYATVVEDRTGQLLGARVAPDGQWRFPAASFEPSEKLKQALLHFEDQHFYYHPGFNPVAIAKAGYENIQAGRIIRGGSTLTQQVIRLARKSPRRTFGEKIIELIWATRLEVRHTKDQILKLYLTHAPFGGNVVGAPMAAYRFFGTTVDRLSWAQAATLAVLPNAPSRIFPGRNQEILRSKRNTLLQKLLQREVIDSLEYRLALLEPLPVAYELPKDAPHFTDWMYQQSPGAYIKSTIDKTLQVRVEAQLINHHQKMHQKLIENGAVLVADLHTNEVLAYVGNTPTTAQFQNQVDMIQAPRSTGSILKPFLYAALLDEGMILPSQLIPDIPTDINGYAPKNFDLTYLGMVPADVALARSLNVPSVRMLSQYGVSRFLDQLRLLGFRHLNQKATHYGLSLILGGGEASLWDIVQAYAGLANHAKYDRTNAKKINAPAESLKYLKSGDTSQHQSSESKIRIPYNQATAYTTLKAMEEVNRPQGQDQWYFFDGGQAVSWKTGTSFGFRDGWAVGVTGKYVVGVWVGNATGLGRPNLTGFDLAAPLLFDVLAILPDREEIKRPPVGFETVDICATSGSLAGRYCPTAKKTVPKINRIRKQCSFHKAHWVDTSTGEMVSPSCRPADQRFRDTFFVLPPVAAHYYHLRNPSNKHLPAFARDCQESENPMAWIYPTFGQKIVLGRDVDGISKGAVFQIAHLHPERKVYWYVEGRLIGESERSHQLTVDLPPGTYRFKLIDQDGYKLEKSVDFF